MSALQRKIIVIDAPSNLGLRPPGPGREPGVTGLAAALRRAGIISNLAALDGGRVVPGPYKASIDPNTGIRNSAAIRSFSIDLARHVGSALDSGYFPLVLGGDCSILIGSMLALRGRGRFGLCFIDGHTDFGSPSTSQTGGAAGMDLALVCGYGPDELTDINHLRPLVQARDVALLGHRDVTDPATYAWRDIFQTEIDLYPLEVIRQMGPEEATRKACKRLRENGTEGFWIHLDADVLDDAIMPAVDSRQPGGLSYAELRQMLRLLVASGAAVGMQITIFDPTLDQDGRIARAFTQAVVDGLNG